MSGSTKVAVALSAAALVAAGVTSSGGTVTVAAQPRTAAGAGDPNVILFLVDDATVEDVQYMPQVQRLLADQGVTFTRNYSPFSMCCPARATILTGLYPHNHRVLDNHDPYGGFEVFNDSQTIAKWLNDDYATALVGKYLNDYADTAGMRRYIPPGWDKWNASVEPKTYNYIDQRININGELVDFEGEYSTRLFGRLGRTFLSTQRGGPQPFFLYEAFVAPHNGTPRDPDDIYAGNPFVEPRYRDTYAGPPIPADPSYNEADVSDKQSGAQDNPPLTPDEIAAISERLAQRRESLSSVDDEIAATIRKIRRMGELDNTYFIFTSDNGFMQGQHRIPSRKSVAYEPAARVPLIIRGPGMPSGTTYGGLTGLQDLAPTILSMTNQWRDQDEPPLDGRSLLNLVGKPPPNRAIVLEVTTVANDVSDNKVAKLDEDSLAAVPVLGWKLRGIVTQKGWKYVEYPQSGGVEMYDLNTDPYELQNLAGNPAFTGRQARLAERLGAMKFCDGVECR